MMKILYIGTPQIYERWKEGKNPSHWLYGAVEMEQDGHTVLWKAEQRGGFHDVTLVLLNKPDVVFIPTFNFRAHLLLLFLSAIGIIRVPIYTFVHHTPNGGKLNWLLRFCLNAAAHVFFLSEKTMGETVSAGFIDSKKASVPGWGPDMHFYGKVETHPGEYFVSTGKEMRDFDILIEAFRKTGVKLKIITCKSHAGNDFRDLHQKCKGVQNIEVVITENSGSVFPLMLREMANAKALVCPLMKDKLNYCVGLSTITDAEGLQKPLIITENPYHSKERTASFKVVKYINDWARAIEAIERGVDSSKGKYSMKACYANMKKIMNL